MMRDAEGIQTIDGFNYLASVPEGEVIVSMAVNNDMLFVATDRHIYVLVDDKRLEMID